MKVLLHAASLVIVLVVSAWAAERPDLTLNDGRVLKSARITSISDSEVTIVCADGIISVPADSVPRGSLAHAKAEIDARETERKQTAEHLAKAETHRLARQQDETTRREALPPAGPKARPISQSIDADLRVVQVWNDGLLASGRGQRGSLREVQQGYPNAKPGPGLDAHKFFARESVNFPKLFYVHCKPAGLIDGSRVSLRIWPAGTRSYTTTAGAKATVAAYTTDP